MSTKKQTKNTRRLVGVGEPYEIAIPVTFFEENGRFFQVLVHGLSVQDVTNDDDNNLRSVEDPELAKDAINAVRAVAEHWNRLVVDCANIASVAAKHGDLARL